MPDLTQDPKVLEACGWGFAENVFDGFKPSPTMDELWEGLCKVCVEAGYPQPVLNGMTAVNISPHDLVPGCSVGATEAGSLRNAIAAAILWLLERKEA